VFELRARAAPLLVTKLCSRDRLSTMLFGLSASPYRYHVFW
jgi:hypothetical protein